MPKDDELICIEIKGGVIDIPGFGPFKIPNPTKAMLRFADKIDPIGMYEMTIRGKDNEEESDHAV